MKIQTKTMGEVEIEQSNLLNIPAGLYGFEEFSEYALIDSEYKPFMWLQSLQERNLAFLLIDPFLITGDYEAEIPDSDLEKIGIEDPSDVLVMTIVTVPKNGGDVTANFQGPLVINRKNRRCMQAVLDNSKWTTKYNIMEALRSKGC